MGFGGFWWVAGVGVVCVGSMWFGPASNLCPPISPSNPISPKLPPARLTTDGIGFILISSEGRGARGARARGEGRRPGARETRARPKAEPNPKPVHPEPDLIKY